MTAVTTHAFAWIKGARAQAARPELSPLAAHVLLILATYANRNGAAWPSIATIARDAGRSPTEKGKHSGVSRALRELESLDLVRTTRKGHGQPALRQLTPLVLGISEVPHQGPELPGRRRTPADVGGTAALTARREVPGRGTLAEQDWDAAWAVARSAAA